MYTRSYYPETTEKVNIPENYDGNAFTERQVTEAEPEIQATGGVTLIREEGKEESVLAGLGKIPFLSGLFGKGGSSFPIKLRMPEIGTEEILILAAAAFLFFSKDGDKECAIMLILLLLIN